MHPTISVVIPLYNAEPWIASTLLSALKQTLVPTEVVVVDDGSTDRGVEVCQEIADSSRVPIRVVSQNNQGQAYARNRGVEEASSELVAFLDSDDVWLSNKLERQVSLLSQYQFEAVTCGFFAWKPTRTIVQESLHFDWTSKRVHQWSLGYGVGAALASTLMIHSATFRDMIGFREDMNIFTDLDFAIRLLRRGKVAAVRDPLVAYRQHPVQIHRRVDQLLPEARFFAEMNLTDADALTLQKNIHALSAFRMLRHLHLTQLRRLIDQAPVPFARGMINLAFTRTIARLQARRLVWRFTSTGRETWKCLAACMGK